MKIKNIEIYNIYSNSIIIIVTTDQDLEGIGQFIGFSIKSQINFLEQNIKPILIHRSPLEVEELWNEMYWRCHGKNGWLQVIAAIDIALHDILCKFKNIPLWKKLGAQAASPINLYWSMGHGHKKTNSEMLELIEKGQGLGFKSFKIRMDWHENNPNVDAEKDLSMVHAVRSHLGDETHLGFDANGGYTAEVAINQSKKLKDLGIEHFEEPVATNDLFELKNVINNAALPISFGEYEKTYMRFLEIIEITGLKIIQPDILNIGGITQLKYLYDYAKNKDLIIMPHSPDVGILSFSSLHMYSLLNSDIPHEYSDELCLRDHNIAQEYFNEDILPKEGQILLTDKPGIGLSLNKKNLIKKKII